MSSTTCAEEGGGSRSQSIAPKYSTSAARGELWGRRRRSLLRSHEHKSASSVLAHIGKKASGQRKGTDRDRGGERGEEEEEDRGGGVEATTDLSTASTSCSGNGGGGTCSLITGEATPAMLYWEHKGLSLLPRWLACVHPTVKLIVTLRDPVQVFVDLDG
jgi:hypothetical protein